MKKLKIISNLETEQYTQKIGIDFSFTLELKDPRKIKRFEYPFEILTSHCNFYDFDTHQPVIIPEDMTKQYLKESVLEYIVMPRIKNTTRRDADNPILYLDGSALIVADYHYSSNGSLINWNTEIKDVNIDKFGL